MEENPCPSETGFRFPSPKNTTELPKKKDRISARRSRSTAIVWAPLACRFRAGAVGRGVKLAPGNPTVDGRNPAPPGMYKTL